MEFADVLPYLVTVLTGICSFFGSYLLSFKKAKQEIRQIEINHKHELDKLMSQHSFDIQALEQKHKMEMELKDKEHMHKLDIIQKQHENEITRKEKEIEDTAKFGAIKDILGPLVLNSPEINRELQNIVKNSFRK